MINDQSDSPVWEFEQSNIESVIKEMKGRRMEKIQGRGPWAVQDYKEDGAAGMEYTHGQEERWEMV